MIERGAVNAWLCPDCGKATVGVHVDEGATPMMIACRATEGCRGTAMSAMYPPAEAWITDQLAWEWYKPTPKWARRKGRDMLDHVMQGGLVIRPLTDEGRRALGLVA
jgi:hypothetical protein